ncbi:hypothetical protein BJ742DRAFT_781099 [Cladochytrium replicatum]|nr:hypothetical protein BJ742DRAFT_781099 [Cladochytrium replicatum]
MPPPQPTAATSLTQRLSKIVVSLQFVWFLGHVTTVFQTFMYLFYSRFAKSGASSYSKAYYGTMLSFCIILYKAHGVPQFSRAYLQRILMDENTQYLLLSLIWLTSGPIWVTLIPFCTFSFFHALTYTREQILPNLFPAPGAATPGTFSFARAVSNRIGQFMTTYQTPALYFVAYTEVYIIFPYVVLSILFGRASILTPLLYGHFLRFRHFFSPMTKEAFRDARTRFDGWILGNASVPAFVKSGYTRVRDLIEKYGNVEGEMMRPQQQQGQQPAAQQ